MSAGEAESARTPRWRKWAALGVLTAYSLGLAARNYYLVVFDSTPTPESFNLAAEFWLDVRLLLISAAVYLGAVLLLQRGREELALEWRGGIMPVVHSLWLYGLYWLTVVPAQWGIGYVLWWGGQRVGVPWDWLYFDWEAGSDLAMAASGVGEFWYFTAVQTPLFTALPEELLRAAALAALLALFGSGMEDWRENTAAAGWAVLISAVLFAVPHVYQGWGELLEMLPFGFFFAAVILYFRSVWPAVVTHVIVNAVWAASHWAGAHGGWRSLLELVGWAAG